MGLDMYLKCNSKKVCQTVNDMTDEWETWQAKHGIIIQWRKANQIHKWFVDNIQGGFDDCGTYDVSVSDLVKLHDVCQEVLESTTLVDGNIKNGEILQDGKLVPKIVHGQLLNDARTAKEILPTCKGFFFGSQDYDQWYWWDVQYTERKLAKLLDCLVPSDSWEVYAEDEPDWCVTFQYHASW